MILRLSSQSFPRKSFPLKFMPPRTRVALSPRIFQPECRWINEPNKLIAIQLSICRFFAWLLLNRVVEHMDEQPDLTAQTFIQTALKRLQARNLSAPTLQHFGIHQMLAIWNIEFEPMVAACAEADQLFRLSTGRLQELQRASQYLLHSDPIQYAAREMRTNIFM